jgi:hypothetical protein
VPVVAVAVAVNETVTVQVGLHGLFVKVAVTPVGSVDVTEKVTGAVVPTPRVAIIEEVGLVVPWTTVRLAGKGVERLKSNETAAVTVSVPVELTLAWVGSPR